MQEMKSNEWLAKHLDCPIESSNGKVVLVVEGEDIDLRSWSYFFEEQLMDVGPENITIKGKYSLNHTTRTYRASATNTW